MTAAKSQIYCVIQPCLPEMSVIMKYNTSSFSSPNHLENSLQTHTV